MGNLHERAQNLLVFHVSGLDCAFPLDAVQEIVPMALLVAPLGLPSGLAGFLDLRGTAIPIIRLDRLFDLPEQKPGLHTPMIVFRGTLGPIGILVESVRGIVPVASGELLDLGEERTFHGCATGAIEVDGDRIYLLSPASLLQANEHRIVADFADLSRARLLQWAPTPVAEAAD